MISTDKCRKLCSNLEDLTEEEVAQVRSDLYQLADIALSLWVKDNADSKNLEWLLPKSEESLT